MSDHYMKKDSPSINKLITVILSIVIMIVVILLFTVYKNLQDIKKLNVRITNLEQDSTNTKEVLDANGIEDLNL